MHALMQSVPMQLFMAMKLLLLLHPFVPTLTTAVITLITGNSATGGGNVTVGGGADVTARVYVLVKITIHLSLLPRLLMEPAPEHS